MDSEDSSLAGDSLASDLILLVVGSVVALVVVSSSVVHSSILDVVYCCLFLIKKHNGLSWKIYLFINKRDSKIEQSPL